MSNLIRNLSTPPDMICFVLFVWSIQQYCKVLKCVEMVCLSKVKWYILLSFYIVLELAILNYLHLVYYF